MLRYSRKVLKEKNNGDHPALNLRVAGSIPTRRILAFCMKLPDSPIKKNLAIGSGYRYSNRVQNRYLRMDS